MYGSADLLLAFLAQSCLVFRHHGGSKVAHTMLANRMFQTEILRCADSYVYL